MAETTKKAAAKAVAENPPTVAGPAKKASKRTASKRTAKKTAAKTAAATEPEVPTAGNQPPTPEAPKEPKAKAVKWVDPGLSVVQGNNFPHPEVPDVEAYTPPKEK